MSTNENQNVQYLVPENALECLPEEWRSAIQIRAEDGRKILAVADKELDHLSRLSLSYYHLTALRFVCDRLAQYKLQVGIDSILELDMLTTAFVTTYARIISGGWASGFSRKSLPEALRTTHDEILDIRNKRYAHSDEHHSVNDEMEIQEENGQFIVNMKMKLGFYIGGSNDWPKIVDALDEIFVARGQKIVERLEARTGRKWSLATGPLPDVRCS
jgi:hypothetical protein